MITVFGSINLDLVVRAPYLPAPGETVLGGAFAAHPGGKGANQALAAQRAGGSVRLIGAVGGDSFADPALALLRVGGIDLAGVRTLPGSVTGVALIAVDDRAGENQILVAPGANSAASAAWLPALGAQDILLLQGELPFAETLRAARTAKGNGARVVWNLAPVPPDPPADFAEIIDLLVVNEGEAAALTGESAPEGAAQGWPGDIVITLGADGALARFGHKLVQEPARHITPIDTTGAGDATVGALVAAVSRGAPPATALRFALAAGSLACLKEGAQPSFALRAEIEAFWGQR
jgi:ribokinase